MFGCRPRLLVNFVFPTIGSNEIPTREASAKHVDVYLTSVWDRLRTTLWEAQAQLVVEACRTETVLQQKDRHSELEAWQPGTSEGRFLEGKEKDQG